MSWESKSRMLRRAAAVAVRSGFRQFQQSKGLALQHVSEGQHYAPHPTLLRQSIGNSVSAQWPSMLCATVALNGNRSHFYGNQLHPQQAESLMVPYTLRSSPLIVICPHVLPERNVEIFEASSTLKKRRLKMNRHKYRKRRKRDRRRTKS